MGLSADNCPRPVISSRYPHYFEMANSDIKIIYFDIPGRAEVSRLILVMAGKDFEDVRVNGEKWREIKPNMPFGTCPVLELDNKMYGQSKAIATYLATVFGFYGKTNLDCLKIDQVMYLIEDFIQDFGNLHFYEKDESKKIEGDKKLKEEIGPRYLGYLEKMMEENGGCFLVGDSLSLADIMLFDMCTGFLGPYTVGCIDNYPSVKKLVDSIGSNERIKAHMAKRK